MDRPHTSSSPEGGSEEDISTGMPRQELISPLDPALAQNGAEQSFAPIPVRRKRRKKSGKPTSSSSKSSAEGVAFSFDFLHDLKSFPVAIALLFLASFAAIMLAGGADQGSYGIFFIVSGVTMLLCKPKHRIAWPIWLCFLGFIACACLPLLPQAWFAKPAWRSGWETAGAPLAPTLSVAPRETIFYIAMAFLSFPIGFFALSQEIRSSHKLQIALGAVGAISLYALLSMYSQSSGWQWWFDTQPTFGFFPNRNHTAAFLVIGCLLSIGILGLPRKPEHWVPKGVAVLGLLTCGVALFFYSVSRGGVLFFAVGLALWIIGLGPKHRTRFQLTIISVAALVALVFFIGSESAAQKRLFTLAGLEDSERMKQEEVRGIDAKSDPSRDVLFDVRLLVYLDAFKLIGDYPLTGAGMGTFPYVFTNYRDASLRNEGIGHPESDWLQLLADVGIPGFLCFAGLTVLLARYLFRSERKEHPYWPLQWGIACAALAVLLHGMLDVPSHRIQLGWWVMLIIAIALNDSSWEKLKTSGWLQRIAFWFFGAAAICAGVVLLRAEWFMGDPTPPFEAQVAENNIVQAFQDNRWDDAVTLARTAISQSPATEALYFQLGCLLLNFENTADEVDRLFAIERKVEPNWPEVTRRQGEVWLYVTPEKTAPLWLDSMRRQQASDAHTKYYFARSLYRWFIWTAYDYPDVMKALLEPKLGADLTWVWMQTVPPEVAWFAFDTLASDKAFLDSLSADDRRQLIAFWIRTGPFDKLQEFALHRTNDWGPAIWPVGIRQLIEDGHFDTAFQAVAGRFALDLSLPPVDTTLVSTTIAGASLAGALPSATKSNTSQAFLPQPSVATIRVAGSATLSSTGAASTPVPNDGPVAQFKSPSLNAAAAAATPITTEAQIEAHAQAAAAADYYHSGLKLADLSDASPILNGLSVAVGGRPTLSLATPVPTQLINGQLVSLPPPQDLQLKQFTFYWQRGNEISARRVLKEDASDFVEPTNQPGPPPPPAKTTPEIWRLRAALAAADLDWRNAWDDLLNYLSTSEQALW